MRFTRLEPATTNELKQAVLEDLDAVAEGMRVIASGVSVPGLPSIDLLAADQRGRLTILRFALTAGPDDVAGAVAQWGWATASLPTMRSLMSVPGLDLTAEPRVILVTGRPLASARSLAAAIPRPEVRLMEATLVGDGDRRGVLAEPVPLEPLPAAAGRTGLDPVLAALPPGEPRSLMRRVLEELSNHGEGRPAIEAVALDGGVDLIRHGAVVATLVAGEGELQVRRPGGEPPRRVATDAGCREIVEWLAGPAGPEADSDMQAGRGESPVAAALSPEEIAEFERFASEDADSRAGHNAPAALTYVRSRFVEN